MTSAANATHMGNLRPISELAMVEAAKRLSEVLRLGSSERDLNRAVPFDEFEAVADSGILTARVPQSYGGPEITSVGLSKIFVLLGAGDPNLTQAILPHLCFMEKVRIYGTEKQQEALSARIMAGEMITNASAERSGKVVGELSTKVASTNGGYVVRGKKYYCTGSSFAQAFFILCMTEDGSRALAIVPRDRAGLMVVDDWDGMGQRTTASGTVALEDVEITSDELIRLNGFGKKPTHEGGLAQLLHSAIDAGIAQAALDDAIRYGRTGARPVSESGVARAGDDPYVQHAIGEMAMFVHSAIALVERAAITLDKAIYAVVNKMPVDRIVGEASIDVAEAKMASEFASLKVSEMIYRIGGASATSRALNLDRHWRNARTHTTHDPVAYKAKAVGDFYLNDRLPPINTKY